MIIRSFIDTFNQKSSFRTIKIRPRRMLYSPSCLKIWNAQLHGLIIYLEPIVAFLIIGFLNEFPPTLFYPEPALNPWKTGKTTMHIQLLFCAFPVRSSLHFNSPHNYFHRGEKKGKRFLRNVSGSLRRHHLKQDTSSWKWSVKLLGKSIGKKR